MVSSLRKLQLPLVSPPGRCQWHKGLQAEREDAHFVSVSNHRGPESFLDDITQDLVNFVSLGRDRGMPVSTQAGL